MEPSPQLLEGAALPLCLQHLPRPPARLYLHGILPHGPRVAIVGTRGPTEAALEYAGYLAKWLAERGVAVVSGGAKGIDAAAHQGALAASGCTLVVASSSFDRPFPWEHRQLFEDIVAGGGGYVSRFERGVGPRRHQFLDRNGLMVALSQAVILVEAPLRSGARNAAQWARRLARPCFVVPSPPWNERGRGCILELQLGAWALGEPEEVLRAIEEPAGMSEAPSALVGPEALGGNDDAQGPNAAAKGTSERDGRARSRCGKGKRALHVPPSPPVPPPDDGSLSSGILRTLRGGARYADEIAEALGASLPELNHALMLLILRGDVDQGPGGEITITRR
jgi:DNA processing protein